MLQQARAIPSRPRSTGSLVEGLGHTRQYICLPLGIFFQQAPTLNILRSAILLHAYILAPRSHELIAIDSQHVSQARVARA